MSVFSYEGRAPLPIKVRVTGNTATTIADATNNTLYVPWFQVNEHSGATPNLTVDVYDGTNAVYLAHDEGSTWNARAVAAYGTYQFTRGLVIPKGSLLRVTSNNASGLFHVHGVYQLVV